MSYEFQIGDRVVCVEPDGNISSTERHRGQIGTIKLLGPVYKNEQTYHIEYDEAFADFLHSCHGEVRRGYGWTHFGHELALLDETTIEVNDLL